MKRSKLFDQARSSFVAKTPEEEVRQALVHHMVESLSYPKSMLSVERGLSCLPNNQDSTSQRRVDVICYFSHPSKGISPLLLIECKKKLHKEQALSQVLGYNEEIKAPFIAIADKESLYLFWRDDRGVQEIDYLPRYDELIHYASH